jgi:hypothetical protein
MVSFSVGLLLRGTRSVKRDQADRAISKAQLHALPRFHTPPIDGMVCPGSRGVLVLRGVSRLDAFSGYPGRT